MKATAIAVLFIVCASVVVVAQAPATKLSRIYEKWIEEDVAYIVSNEDIGQFKSLKSDEERDQFIIAFWSHRDPTPGTIKNEYKEEHYRRIAYANVHFADRVPGWKTDRGRIYIVYGPPTRIDRPASGENYVEDWRYRANINDSRNFRFVDACKCGEFRLETESVKLQ